MKTWGCSLVAGIILGLAVTDAFNVDVDSRVVHTGPRGCQKNCMFGFSVAQHREQGTPW